MERKLVQQGASTLMVSLPSKWVKEHGLAKGSPVHIDADGAALVVTATLVQQKRSTRIAIKSAIESEVRTLLTNTYRAGYDRIEAAFETQEQLSLIRSIVESRLLGFEVTSAQQHVCIIEDIAQPSTDKFDAIIEKVWLNVGQSITWFKAHAQGDVEGLEGIDAISARLQRYDNYCRRVLAKQGGAGANLHYWSLLGLLVHAQRELLHASKVKLSASKQHVIYVDRVKALFDILHTSYLHKDIAMLSKVHGLEKEIVYSAGYKLIESTRSPIAFHLVSCARRLYQANSPLMALLLPSE